MARYLKDQFNKEHRSFKILNFLTNSFNILKEKLQWPDIKCNS